MAEYKEHKAITFSSEQEKHFRDLLNKFCDNEKAYHGPNIGKEIKILQVIDAPIYRAELATQYDKRTFELHSQSTQEYFQPTISKPSEVNRWKVAGINSPSAFCDLVKEFTILESRETRTCHTCNGAQKVTCEHCHGNGTITQTRTRQKTCLSCNGTGYYTSTSTETYWTNPGSQIKYNCDGDGRIMQSKTITHKHTCSKCNGNGKIQEEYQVQVTCPTCGGNKKVVCPTCKGTGLMMHYFSVKQQAYKNTLNRWFYPDLVQKDEFNEFSENIDSSLWQLSDRYDIQGTQFDTCEGKNLPVVGGMVGRLCASVNENEETHICFNRLSIYTCPAIAIEYQWNEKKYHCVLLGTDWQLFSFRSPISDYFEEQRESVQSEMQKGNVSAAWKKMKNVLDSSQSNTTDTDAIMQIQQRMRLTTHYGKILGSLITIVALLPLLIDYFAHYNIVAPWTDLVYRFVYLPQNDAILRAVISFAISFYLIKTDFFIRIPKFLYLHSSGFIRMLNGILWGILLTVVATAIMLVLNYFGVFIAILAVMAIALGIVTTIIWLLVFLIMLAIRFITTL